MISPISLLRFGPDWYGGNELHGAGVPGVLSPWRRAASRLASSGRAPRFRHTPARIELQQLMLAVDPTGLILLAAGKAWAGALVARFSQIDGYRYLSLIRASAVVNCQSALAWLTFRSPKPRFRR